MFAIILKLIIVVELIAISYFVIKTIMLYCQHSFSTEPNTNEKQALVISKSDILNEKTISIIKNLKEIPYVG